MVTITAQLLGRPAIPLETEPSLAPATVDTTELGTPAPP